MKKKFVPGVVVVGLTVLVSSMVPSYAARNDTGVNSSSNESVDADFQKAINSVVVHEPPKGFNPLTASADELDYYNYPPRPTNAEAYDRWTKVVMATRYTPKFTRGKKKPTTTGNMNKGFSREINGASYTTHNHWNGVVSQKTYSEVTGYWVQKLVTSDSSHTPSESSSWIGLGGFEYQNLIQMGTDSSTGSYSPWYEIYQTSADTNGSIDISNSSFPYTVGDEFYGDVWWTTSGNYGTAHFYIVDTTHNASYGISIPNITNFTGVTSSAEWIFERPKDPGTPTYYLSKVANLPFSFCSAGPQGGTLSHPDPYDPSTFYVKMVDNYTGVTMANETTIDYSGNYSSIWVDYGSGH